MTIRELAANDIPEVLVLGRHMHDESAYSGLRFAPYKVREACNTILGNKGHLGLVAEKDGKVVGMFSGYVAKYDYGHDLVAYDGLLYVEPEHRGGTAAVKFIQLYGYWAEKMGAKQIFLGQTTGVEIERVHQLYQRLGFEHLGGCYRKA